MSLECMLEVAAEVIIAHLQCCRFSKFFPRVNWRISFCGINFTVSVVTLPTPV